MSHPEYYPRFGFLPAARCGLRGPFAVPEEVFMALPLRPGEPPSAGRMLFPAPFLEF